MRLNSSELLLTALVLICAALLLGPYFGLHLSGQEGEDAAEKAAPQHARAVRERSRIEQNEVPKETSLDQIEQLLR